ncbi:MAG: hypothetical protein H0W72_06185 [Planctomycetes bacterium]|nr:hypothetical protein [Planctomycetota bacterium]
MQVDGSAATRPIVNGVFEVFCRHAASMEKSFAVYKAGIVQPGTGG